MNIFKDDREKRKSEIIFALYLFVLCWLVLFKLSGNVSYIEHIRLVKLIPYEYGFGSAWTRKEIFFNIVVFIPAGFYFTAFFRDRGRYFGLSLVFFLSLTFEILQWIFSIGVTDMTDLCNNSLGGSIGTAFFYGAGYLLGQKRMKIINRLAVVCEVTGGLLLLILVVLKWDFFAR